MRASCLLGSWLLFSSASVSASEGDWFASLYTLEGVELRADERVFTLFALFNAMGYDTAPTVRAHPIPRYQFHAVRQQVREKLAGLPVELRRKADAFFDAHPRPLAHYLAYALNSSPPPFRQGARAKELVDLKGLEALLAEVYAAARLDEVMASVQQDYRKALKAYFNGLDAPMVRARKLLKLSEKESTSTVVMNLLDAEGAARGVQGESEVFLVMGPNPTTANIEGAVREFAKVFLEAKVSKKTQAGWGGGASLLREAQLKGARESSPGEYAVALLARALALRAMDAGDAAYEKAASEGYFGLKDIARFFDEPGSVDSWVLEALARAETRRP